MIYNLLIKAQQGNQEAMLELINRFQPLLKKYARKLRYDDAYEDCQLFYIELIKKMDYVKGYSVAEIARVCHKSRQAVNQLKKRALNKLKQIVGTESAK